MKQLKLGPVSMPITQFASQGNAVLGIRDSGKSYSATFLAEQLYNAGIPFVAFDPSGVWKFLRVPGKGNGLPVVVAGGKTPDLPLTPASAPEIVRAAMRANVSLVVDLYDIHISKADWSRIVEACIRVLLYENGEHGLRHIFIEEAAEFAPQIVGQDKAKVYAEVEKLVRIGGNALLGYTLINQRAEQVNKACLELCDCLFLHRQKGKNSLKSLEKWLEYSQGSDTKEIIKGLPTLPSGQCWLWPAGADHATHIHMPQKETFHPDRRALIANPAAANVKRVDAAKFVTELKGSLEKYLDEAKANDPAALKKRIAELEKATAAKPIKNDAVAAIDKTQLKKDLDKSFYDGVAKGCEIASAAIKGKLTGVLKAGDAMIESLRAVANAVVPLPTKLPVRSPSPVTVTLHPQDAKPEIKRALIGMAKTVVRQQLADSSGALPKGEATILRALIQFPDGLRREQITVLTTFARSTRDRYLQYLQAKGLVNGSSDIISVTDEGRAMLPDAEPLPTGQQLQEYWFNRLPTGEAKILRVLVDRYPDSIGREELTEATGFARSTRDRYLQYMQNKQIVVTVTDGVQAHEALF